MKNEFDLGVMDEILQKASEDETGKMSAAINDLIMAGRQAGKAGFELKEIAAVTTMGYYVSREPELETMINFLLSKTQPADDYLN